MKGKPVAELSGISHRWHLACLLAASEFLFIFLQKCLCFVFNKLWPVTNKYLVYVIIE